MIISLFCKNIVAAWLNLSKSLIPWSLAVAAHNREHTACNRSAPTCCCVDRSYKANFFSHGKKSSHVLLAFFACFSSTVTILVFNLNADNRAIVLDKIALCLFISLFIKSSYMLKVSGSISSFFIAIIFGILKKPVRETSVSCFSMSPWADSEDSIKPTLFYSLKEIPKAPVSCKIEFVLHFLVVNPYNIKGNDIHASRLHFAKFFFPVLLGISAKVHFSHNREPSLPINQDADIIKAKLGIFRNLHNILL